MDVDVLLFEEGRYGDAQPPPPLPLPLSLPLPLPRRLTCPSQVSAPQMPAPVSVGLLALLVAVLAPFEPCWLLLSECRPFRVGVDGWVPACEPFLSPHRRPVASPCACIRPVSGRYTACFFLRGGP